METLETHNTQTNIWVGLQFTKQAGNTEFSPFLQWSHLSAVMHMTMGWLSSLPQLPQNMGAVMQWVATLNRNECNKQQKYDCAIAVIAIEYNGERSIKYAWDVTQFLLPGCCSKAYRFVFSVEVSLVGGHPSDSIILCVCLVLSKGYLPSTLVTFFS